MVDPSAVSGSESEAQSDSGRSDSSTPVETSEEGGTGSEKSSTVVMVPGRILPAKINPKSKLTEDDMGRLRRLYRIPESVEIRPPSNDERADHEVPGWSVFYEIMFKVGIRYPVPSLLAEVCRFYSIAPSQWMPNGLRIIIGIQCLREKENKEFSLRDLLEAYSVKMGDPGRYTLVCRRGKSNLITELTSNDHGIGWKKEYFFARGALVFGSEEGIESAWRLADMSGNAQKGRKKDPEVDRRVKEFYEIDSFKRSCKHILTRHNLQDTSLWKYTGDKMFDLEGEFESVDSLFEMVRQSCISDKTFNLEGEFESVDSLFEMVKQKESRSKTKAVKSSHQRFNEERRLKEKEAREEKEVEEKKRTDRAQVEQDKKKIEEEKKKEKSEVTVQGKGKLPLPTGGKKPGQIKKGDYPRMPRGCGDQPVKESRDAGTDDESSLKRHRAQIDITGDDFDDEVRNAGTSGADDESSLKRHRSQIDITGDDFEDDVMNAEDTSTYATVKRACPTPIPTQEVRVPSQQGADVNKEGSSQQYVANGERRIVISISESFSVTTTPVMPPDSIRGLLFPEDAEKLGRLDPHATLDYATAHIFAGLQGLLKAGDDTAKAEVEKEKNEARIKFLEKEVAKAKLEAQEAKTCAANNVKDTLEAIRGLLKDSEGRLGIAMGEVESLKKRLEFGASELKEAKMTLQKVEEDCKSYQEKWEAALKQVSELKTDLVIQQAKNDAEKLKAEKKHLMKMRIAGGVGGAYRRLELLKEYKEGKDYLWRPDEEIRKLEEIIRHYQPSKKIEDKNTVTSKPGAKATRKRKE
ncbi:hypothetical protein HS088_TW18G00248 [Tripterygium wilfordii]|uniref:Uncharacterized protein n=1 Tax=Tripterygium wilfordii TaxID=458696 RepID=A0A7J7CBQ7_TRIWF|nr:uncharacterized protein LOC119983760 [Tripterygium wilfordii]KAF5731568.1 hypothetical protein HS088_TW18G00248 [Tripterygium wilfordii]